MAWITTVPPEEARGKLAEAYAIQRSKLGYVSELTQLGSLYPELVATRLELYAIVDATPSGVPEWVRRAVALLTSVLNRCLFCTVGHSNRLREDGRGDIVDAIVADPEHVTSDDPRVAAVFDYTRALTLRPGDITRQEIELLRAHGWTDLDILDINNIAAYYGYINRVASGLGLQGVG